MMNIELDYQTLKNYYDETLNKNKDLVQTSNDEPTPIDCVEEMINKIPEEFWMKKDIKILDPCCGCGNFPLVVYYKLLKYHNKNHILNNMLYFNDINKERLEILRQVFQDDDEDETKNIVLNIEEKDFLEYDIGIKFDLIMANPPYAKLLKNGKELQKITI